MNVKHQRRNAQMTCRFKSDSTAVILSRAAVSRSERQRSRRM